MVFDQIWQQDRIMSRKSAYAMLARLLKLPPPQAHISKLSITQCENLIQELRGIVEIDL
jgi:hypothetical protein